MCDRVSKLVKNSVTYFMDGPYITKDYINMQKIVFWWKTFLWTN